MKKLLSIALILALALSLSIPTFAAVHANGGSESINVIAKYVDGVSTPTVFNVDVAWGTMEFTYTVSGTKTWDPAKHQYTSDTSGSWTASGNEVTVTNHSNTSIRADFSYEKEVDFDAVTGSFSSASITLPSAEALAVGAAELTGSSALTLAGTLASDKKNLTKVGTVIVTISKVE